jgi:hypothetical protein
VRGKIARELRKAAEFDPNEKRAYETWELSRTGYVLSFGEDGKVSYQEQEVPVFIVECVSAERKLYQYFKRKYIDFGYEEQLRELPSQAEQKELTDQILKGMKEEEGEARQTGGLDDENDIDE